MRSLDAWIGHRKVADFSITRQPDGSELHVIDYVKDVASNELLSLTMPTYGKKSFTTATFPPCFDMILPEGERADRVRAARKLIRNDRFTLLSYVGGNPVNRVRFVPSGSIPTDQPTPLPTPTEIIGCEDGMRLFQSLIDDLDLRQGIAGVQPKILGKPGEDTSKFSFQPRNFRGNTHILKASTARYPFLAANEEACLHVFREAGLPAAEAALSADGQLLLVKRFDVTENGLVGFEEVASLMGETAEGKYLRDYGSMLQSAASFVNQDKAPQARTQLFHALVLNHLIGNGDAHLKNFGLLYTDDVDAELAPFYDCISTLPYVANDVPALCLSEDHYSKAWWPRRQLEAFGREYAELSDLQIAAIFDRSFHAVNSGIEHLAQSAQSIAAFRGSAEQLSELWKQRVASFREEASDLQTGRRSASGRAASNMKYPRG